MEILQKQDFAAASFANDDTNAQAGLVIRTDAGSTVGDAITAATPDATTTVKGLVELATVAETDSFDAVRAVTPAGFKTTLALPTGASLSGWVQDGVGAEYRTLDDRNKEVVYATDFMTAAQKADVKAGTALVDVTAAIQAAHASSKTVHYPRGRYRISWPESSALVNYNGTAGIKVTGENAVLVDTRVYAANSITPVFNFETCNTISINGLHYEGQPIANKSDATSGVGYRGATFVNLSTNCEDVSVDANLKYLRYGVRAGDYAIASQGYSKNIRGTLHTLECGYPIALYLSENINFDLHTEGSHRTAYLAGVHGGKVNAFFKDQYIAQAQVLVTDSTTNGLAYPAGKSRGCANLKITAKDMGSTTWVPNSFCAAISMQRGDAGTVFEDLDFDVSVISNDTTAATLSAFSISNAFTSVQPSYPNNWESTFIFKSIRLTGLLDRSNQTISENGTNGEIYIYATDNTRHGTVQGLDIERFRYMPGTGSKPRGFWIFAPGLVGVSSITASDFGGDTPVAIGTNNASKFVISDTRMRGSYSATSDAPYNSAIDFCNSQITNSLFQPFTNKTFVNTSVQGAGAKTGYLMAELTLAGATSTWAGALPNQSIILGVSGYLTEAITGATGFLVGDGTTAARFCNSNGITVGTTFSVANSSDTSPRIQAGGGNIVLTAKTSNFTGGKMRLFVSYINIASPTS